MNEMEMIVVTLQVEGVGFMRTLLDGRKHQVRRMANALKLTVTSLARIRIGHMQMRALRAGQVRTLSARDINKILDQKNT